MRVVILGDIHLYNLRVMPWRLMGKRLLGQANLWLRRRKRFQPMLLQGVLEHALSLEPDWVLLTGDLTTTTLSGELELAQGALERLAPWAARGRVVMIPGNHDRYTFAAARRRSFEAMFPQMAPSAYPHVMDLSPAWRLIALDSARPRALTSRGCVGHRQLERFAQLLEETPAQQGVVVMCHYPPMLPVGQRQSWSHRLADGSALGRMLESANRRIIFLHGHVHRPWLWRVNGHLQIANAGSPCMTSPRHPLGQGFWQLDLPAGDVVHTAARWLHHMPCADASAEPGGGKPPEIFRKLPWRQGVMDDSPFWTLD